MPAAGGDKQLALRLYIWNARLCEALYLALQLAEVCARNAIHVSVKKRFGLDWFDDARFQNILTERLGDELSRTVGRERKKRTTPTTENHIIAGLSFGFWVQLMGPSYDKHLWANGVRHSFPNAAKDETRRNIHDRLEQMRKFRNDVAHHYAVFDRRPQAEFQNALHITHLVCTQTRWLSNELARVGQVINERPK